MIAFLEIEVYWWSCSTLAHNGKFFLAGIEPFWSNYVHASLDLIEDEHEGLGGTSGFKEGVRFTPDLGREL